MRTVNLLHDAAGGIPPNLSITNRQSSYTLIYQRPLIPHREASRLNRRLLSLSGVSFAAENVRSAANRCSCYCCSCCVLLLMSLTITLRLISVADRWKFQDQEPNTDPISLLIFSSCCPCSCWGGALQKGRKAPSFQIGSG